MNFENSSKNIRSKVSSEWSSEKSDISPKGKSKGSSKRIPNPWVPDQKSEDEESGMDD